MDDVVSIGQARFKSAGSDAEHELIRSPKRKCAEGEDKLEGIPIPGVGKKHKKSYDHRCCGLEMDNDAVLEELAAVAGGFNRDWQCHGRSKA